METKITKYTEQLKDFFLKPFKDNKFEFAHKVISTLALMFLLFIPFAIIVNNNIAAEKLAVWVYYLLLLVVVNSFAEYLYDKILSKAKAKIKRMDFENENNNFETKHISSKWGLAGLLIDKIRSFKYSYLIFIVLVVTLPWMYKSGYIFLTDLSWGPNMKLDYSGSIAVVFKMMHMLGTVIGQAASEKLFVILAILGAGYAGHKVGGIAGTTLAIFNPFIYDRLMYGQIGVIYSYVFTLLIVSIMMKWLGKLDRKVTKLDLVKLSAYYALSALFSMHFIFINGLLLIMMSIIFGKRIYQDVGNSKIYKLIVNVVAIFGVLFLFINSLWISKLYKSGNSTLDYVTKAIGDKDYQMFATAGDGFFSRTWNILNMQGFWGSQTNTYLNLKHAGLYFLPSIVFWLMAIGGLYYVYFRSKKSAVTIGFTIILSVILAQATSIPFIKNILYNIPFYSGLREPQKWVALTVALFIMLIIIFLKSEKENKYYKYVIPALSILWVPYMLFGAWGQPSVANYPSYYSNLNQTLNNNKCFDGKVVIMPWHLYVRYSWVGRVTANPAANYFDCPVITGTNMEWGSIYDNSTDETGKAISNFVLRQGEADMPVGVNAIVLFKDVDYKQYDFLSAYNVFEETADYIIYDTRIDDNTQG